MRIRNNTYYVRYWIVRGKEYTSLSHYKDVWSNGYTVDEYSFDNKSFHFEDAGHYGINPDYKFAGTKISKRYFERWVKKMNDCKQEIERMVKEHSSPYGERWKVCDYLYFPLKEIFAEEDAKEIKEYPDEYIEEDNKYTEPELCLILVMKTDSEKPEGLEIRVNEYRTDYDDEQRPIDYYLNYIDKSRLIPKEIYDKAKELIHKEATEIMKEIKQKVK